jgi:hypothetical protein
VADTDKIVRVSPEIVAIVQEQLLAINGDIDSMKEVMQEKEFWRTSMSAMERMLYQSSLEHAQQKAAPLEAFLNAYRNAPPVDSLTVAYGWSWEGMKGLALGHLPPTPENSYQFHERKTKVYPLMIIPTED